MPADVEESEPFEDVLVVPAFIVAGSPCPAPPLEAWRAPAAGIKTQMLSSAQAITLNRTLRIPWSAWNVNVNP